MPVGYISKSNVRKYHQLLSRLISINRKSHFDQLQTASSSIPSIPKLLQVCQTIAWDLTYSKLVVIHTQCQFCHLVDLTDCIASSRSWWVCHLGIRLILACVICGNLVGVIQDIGSVLACVIFCGYLGGFRWVCHLRIRSGLTCVICGNLVGVSFGH